MPTELFTISEECHRYLMQCKIKNTMPSMYVLCFIIGSIGTYTMRFACKSAQILFSGVARSFQQGGQSAKGREDRKIS